MEVQHPAIGPNDQGPVAPAPPATPLIPPPQTEQQAEQVQNAFVKADSMRSDYQRKYAAAAAEGEAALTRFLEEEARRAEETKKKIEYDEKLGSLMEISKEDRRGTNIDEADIRRIMDETRDQDGNLDFFKAYEELQNLIEQGEGLGMSGGGKRKRKYKKHKSKKRRKSKSKKRKRKTRRKRR